MLSLGLAVILAFPWPIAAPPAGRAGLEDGPKPRLKAGEHEGRSPLDPVTLTAAMGEDGEEDGDAGDLPSWGLSSWSSPASSCPPPAAGRPSGLLPGRSLRAVPRLHLRC